MRRFPALLSSNNLNEGRFAAWWSGPVKGGAEGLIAAGRNGIGIAAKSHDGSVDLAIAAMMEAITRVGLLSDAARDAFADVARPPVLGGGRRVGAVEPIKPENEDAWLTVWLTDSFNLPPIAPGVGPFPSAAGWRPGGSTVATSTRIADR